MPRNAPWCWTRWAPSCAARMAEFLFERLCLIGVGLIGSSIARAAKAKGGIPRTIVAHTRRPETLARVRELGFADVVEADASRAVEGADCVILSVPVGAS